VNFPFLALKNTWLFLHSDNWNSSWGGFPSLAQFCNFLFCLDSIGFIYWQGEKLWRWMFSNDPYSVTLRELLVSFKRYQASSCITLNCIVQSFLHIRGRLILGSIPKSENDQIPYIKWCICICYMHISLYTTLNHL
jgi:hypothetical protein